MLLWRVERAMLEIFIRRQSTIFRREMLCIAYTRSILNGKINARSVETLGKSISIVFSFLRNIISCEFIFKSLIGLISKSFEKLSVSIL